MLLIYINYLLNITLTFFYYSLKQQAERAIKEAEKVGEKVTNSLNGIKKLKEAKKTKINKVNKAKDKLDNNIQNKTNACTNNSCEKWTLNPKVDLDWRGQNKTVQDALDEAFKRTGVPIDLFEVTKWGKDANGKSFPTEFKIKTGQYKGAEVNIDKPNPWESGSQVPHVGYQSPGKRDTGGGVRGHILLDDVPYHRPPIGKDR